MSMKLVIAALADREEDGLSVSYYEGLYKSALHRKPEPAAACRTLPAVRTAQVGGAFVKEEGS